MQLEQVVKPCCKGDFEEAKLILSSYHSWYFS